MYRVYTKKKDEDDVYLEVRLDGKTKSINVSVMFTVWENNKKIFEDTEPTAETWFSKNQTSSGLDLNDPPISPSTTHLTIAVTICKWTVRCK